MKLNSSFKLKSRLAGLCMLAASGAACAEDAALNLSLPPEAKAAHSFLLASNDSTSANLPPSVTHSTPTAEFEPPMFSGDKLHQYMGLATVVLAGLTAVTAPSSGCEGVCPATTQPRQTNGTHAQLGKAAGAMAVATVVSGLIDHWDDFHFEDGFSDPDNLHALLGAAGALTMAYAVNKSANSTTPVSHAGVAELGALAMVVAIKLTW
ncbi:MAG: hypothetical protein WCD45_03500 [Gallionella sp.]